jgi:hypothetical protein
LILFRLLEIPHFRVNIRDIIQRIRNRSVLNHIYLPIQLITVLVLFQSFLQFPLLEVVVCEVIVTVGDVGVIGSQALPEDGKAFSVVKLCGADSASFVGDIAQLDVQVADFWGLCA